MSTKAIDALRRPVPRLPLWAVLVAAGGGMVVAAVVPFVGILLGLFLMVLPPVLVLRLEGHPKKEERLHGD